MNNGNMPAMPTEVTARGTGKGTGIQEIQTSNNSWKEFGLTKREYFAAMAMQGFGTRDGYHTFENMAGDAVKAADALLKALEANNENN